MITDRLNWTGEADPPEVRFRKRQLKTQADRDSFGDSLVADMHRAEKAGDWKEYDRIKELLFRTT